MKRISVPARSRRRWRGPAARSRLRSLARVLALACLLVGPPAGGSVEARGADPRPSTALSDPGHHGADPGHHVENQKAEKEEAAAAAGEVLSLDVVAAGGLVDVLTALRGEPDPSLVHRRSEDGGRTWGEEHRVPLGSRPLHAPHRGMDPQIASAGSRLLVVWTTPGTSPWGSGPMVTAYSNDGGRSWSPGGNPANDASTDAHNYVDVVADSEGVFHVVWLDSHGGSRGLGGSSSRDGLTWSPRRTLDDRTCECCWNRIYVHGGHLRVLYRDKEPTDLSLATSTDRGRSWRRRGPAGSFGWRFEGCPHVGGALALTAAERVRLHALSWTGREGKVGLWALTSDDDGRSWARPHRLGSELARHGDLAAVGRHLVAVWDEGPRIFSSWSADRGRSWTSPQRLSDPHRRATHPRAVSTGDRALALWTEKGETGGWTLVVRGLESNVLNESDD